MSFQLVSDAKDVELKYFERLNYFFGKLLTARDFLAEQSYFNEKRWLLNLRTIGWGVVCGLEVARVESCPTQVAVKKGVAIDRYGFEIFLGEDRIIELFTDSGNMGVGSDEASTKTPMTTPPTGSHTFYICIRYKECLSEPVPVPTSSCSSGGKQCDYSRVRELYEIKAHKDLSECETGEKGTKCSKLISMPCDRFFKDCEDRKQFSWIMLAKVSYENGSILKIDNQSERKWIWSNEELAGCLNETVYQAGSARKDRRQFVPLLTQTIKGLKYRDGKVLTLRKPPGLDAGVYPYGITTDGAHIWITDQHEYPLHDVNSKSGKLYKIDRRISPEIVEDLLSTFIQIIPIDYSCWGIAFDGKHIWITHHLTENPGKISRICAATDEVETVDISSLGDHPKEIVYDGKYLIVAHTQPSKISVIDPITCEKKAEQDLAGFEDTEDTFSPHCMAYDGRLIWAAGDNPNEKGLRTIEIREDEQGNVIVEIGESINVGGETPKAVAFDGTHIWVSHNEGLSKVNIHSKEREMVVESGVELAGLAFDGMYVWAGQPGERRAIRVDVLHNEMAGAVSPPDIESGNNYRISRMCFDGIFIWMTAHEETEGGKIGLIHRLLL